MGALIPVRCRSERLPGKALLPLAGRPVLYHLLDRVSRCRFLSPETIVVCTTEDPEDDAIAGSARDYGCSVFRGERDDIIARLCSAMRQYELDAAVHANADNPVTATEYLDLTMARLLDDRSLGIVTSQGLPIGANSCSFSRAAMEVVSHRYVTRKNDTGFMYFFTKTELVKQATIPPLDAAHVLPKARLTLDYPADYELFERLFAALYRSEEVFSFQECIGYLRCHPELLALNANLKADYWRRTKEKATLAFRDQNGNVTNISI